MALFDDLTDGVKKVFLAGVGAAAMGAEKVPELVDDLIKKGELTVEQGKSLNEELTRKVKETTSGASDEMLRSRLRRMSAEEREAWLANAQKIAQDLEAEDVEVEVPEAEVEPADEPTEGQAEDVEA